MATITFTSDTDWVVPEDNSAVTIRCYGEQGEGGSANGGDTDTSGGGNGGYAEGDLSVTPGETLRMRFGGGGSGGFASEGGNSASGGDGGNAADVRQGGDTFGDIRILAGGGGGGGAAAQSNGGDGEAISTGGGGGGGTGEDANDTSGIANAQGGHGGESGGYDGGNGSDSGRDDPGDPCGAGGGGGAGHNGGTGGDNVATHLSSTDFTVAHGTGGGGGDGYTGGVSNSTQTTDLNSGSAKIEVDFTPTPNPPHSVAADANHGVPSVDVTWSVTDSITDGFYVYRSTTQGFTPSGSNRIATINDDTSRSYTDTGVAQDQTYYYIVTAFESTSGNESDDSNEASVEVAETILVWDGNNFVEKPVWRRNDANDGWTSINGISEYDEGGGTWDDKTP